VADHTDHAAKARPLGHRATLNGAQARHKSYYLRPGQIASKLKRFGVQQPETDLIFWALEQIAQER
jgi:hypothetical protein